MLTKKFILISEILGCVLAYHPTVLANPITPVNSWPEGDETAIRVAIPSVIASEPQSKFPGQFSHRLTAADLTDNYTENYRDSQTLDNSVPTAQIPQGRQLFDIQGHWAQTFIESLAVREIIRAKKLLTPDGTFRPEALVTRAEFAAMIRKAFPQDQVIRDGGQLPQISAANQASTHIVGYQPPTSSEPVNVPSPNPDNTASSDLDDAEIEALREQLRIPSLPVVLMPSTLGAAASPGSSSGSPTAFGADFGSVFTGASFQERTRFTTSSDGAVSAGFGLGNATKAVGLEVAVSVLDLTSRGSDDRAFDRGSVSFKLHRRLPNNFAVAVGYENALVWGFTDAGSSVYGVGSKIFQFQDSPRQPFSSLTVSLGVGNGRFRTEDDFNADNKTVNVFGSAGLRVLEPVSVIADWTGQDLTLGASIAPFRNIPIVITPAIADVTGSAGDGSRFILGIGYSYSFSY